MNQSQSSVVTVSAVQLIEDHEGYNILAQLPTNTNIHNQKQSLRSVKSLGNINEGLDMTDPNNEDIESNIDCIDLGTEDEYASSVYTRRSISPTSR